VGTFVAEHSPLDEHAPFFQLLGDDDFSITEFQEIRYALEARSAELAAKRATEEDLQLIEISLERIRNEKDAGVVQMKTDISLHMNIAYASKNTVLIQFMKNFYDLQLHVMDVAYTKIFKSMELIKLIFNHHFEIVDAIKNHNPEKARKAMEEHIGVVLAVCQEHGL
jgi:GntR family transcriptional repressor for pyruvate dehydrogenase complex